ncbi:MAG: hypothetical protein IPL77_10265 [Flavobacteriales bacterium]|nr:hypothetical protein [Flavobacteriales bacterium]
MRPLLKLNPYFAKYGGRLLLGVLFIIQNDLFAVCSRTEVVLGGGGSIAAGHSPERTFPGPAASLHPFTLDVVGGVDRTSKDG